MSYFRISYRTGQRSLSSFSKKSFFFLVNLLELFQQQEHQRSMTWRKTNRQKKTSMRKIEHGHTHHTHLIPLLSVTFTLAVVSSAAAEEAMSMAVVLDDPLLLSMM
jgi:hypothetical protein